jgi:hypothetical protein
MVKRAGVLLEPRQFPCDFLLWGYIKDLVYSIPIDITEVLTGWKMLPQQFAIIEVGAGKSGRIISSAPSLLY